MNGHFLDFHNVHPAILPVDSQSGASSGIVVSLKNAGGVCIFLMKKAGTAGDDPVFTITQAKTVAGGSEKALPLPANRVRSKLHATTVPGLFTDVGNAAAAGGTYTDDTAAEKAGIIAVHINAADLDVDNEFDCVRLAIPDTGAAGAQLIAAWYTLFDVKYGGAGMVSPIAD